MDGKNRKLYLVGIDSAPLWIIKKLAKESGMRGFGTFLKDGSLMEMESTVPPVTSVAWPTIYTGLEPKEHGIIDFSSINKNYEKDISYYDTNKHVPFWDTLAEKGLSCLVVTPAVTLQKSKYKNVDMITGWPLGAKYSSQKIEDVCKKFKYEGEPDIGNQLNTGKLTIKDASRIWSESTKTRADVSKYLIDRYDYDMAFICFTETDRIQHYSLNLDNWEECVAPVYKEISNFIEYLDKRIKKMGEDAVIMIVSDHGSQQIHHKFLSNSWMINEGYANLKSGIYKRGIFKSNKDPISKVKSKIVNKLVESKLRRTIYTKMPKSLQKLGESFVEESFDYESQGKYIRIKESDFDMPKTRAFCSVSFGPMGLIWVNDSRFSNPCVPANERSALVKEIIQKLLKIKDLEGRNLIKGVYDGPKFFSKSNSLIIPDIIFELEDGYTADYSGYRENLLYTEPEINRRGEHTKTGIFGIRPYRSKIKLIKKRDLSLSEVNPTILKYFGIDSIKRDKSLI
jgi:predicted AlkP superfamily phosphohydrolase/phosphomutase